MINHGIMPAAFVLAALYAAHQDFWFWRDAQPIVFGVLPVGLFYHAAYTVLCAAVLWVAVRRFWPAHLEHLADRSGAPEE
jgi:hypothetical protein